MRRRNDVTVRSRTRPKGTDLPRLRSELVIRGSRVIRMIGTWTLLVLGLGLADAGTVQYQYDEHGRLKRVTYETGAFVEYSYDNAGNRTQVVTAVAPGIPASITVPASSTTGSYTITWGAANGTVSAYELYEATNSSFSGQVLVHNGSSTSKALSGRDNGTYYYRVRACNQGVCSNYRTGTNPITVTLPPGIPSSISVPANGISSYTISWGAASGTVTAYELYEATNSTFSGQVLAYSGTGTSKAFSGKSVGTYYYRVRACNGSSCSGYRTGANGIVVSVIPATPTSISGPTQSSGSFAISWSSSAGATRYELWESVFGGAFTKVYDGANTFKSFSNKPSGEYQYKAKACSTAGCSGFTSQKFVLVCNPSCL